MDFCCTTAASSGIGSVRFLDKGGWLEPTPMYLGAPRRSCLGILKRSGSVRVLYVFGDMP